MSARVLIVDDEVLARIKIRQLLESEEGFEVMGECESGETALAFIQQQHPDLLFLDIQMPGMSGFDVLRSLPPNEQPATIFVTADARHAVQAFEVHALDYLLKPFKPARFSEALQRARVHLDTRQAEAAADSDGLAQGSARRTTHITVKTGTRTVFLPVEQLDYVESAANYAILHSGAESHILRETLTNLATRLPPDRFLRVSRSTIVNIGFINEAWQESRHERGLLLKNGRRVPVTCSVREIRRRLETVQGGA
jgi:two-component system LytT family response regulator